MFDNTTSPTVSPEFRLRPSLSGDRAHGAGGDRPVSPEFRLRPSLSGCAGRRPSGCHEPVSPEFRLRPSLSGVFLHRFSHEEICVAGVQTPAFVERLSGGANRQRPWEVSPEFRLRPSLSGGAGLRHRARRRVSPEFRLRPSLSVLAMPDEPRSRPVSPEFRLRPSLSAFRRLRPVLRKAQVSPEFRLRPSLSARAGGVHGAPLAGVAGVQTPAFVERSSAARAIARRWRCRRSSDSGLR